MPNVYSNLYIIIRNYYNSYKKGSVHFIKTIFLQNFIHFKFPEANWSSCKLKGWLVAFRVFICVHILHRVFFATV